MKHIIKVKKSIDIDLCFREILAADIEADFLGKDAYLILMERFNFKIGFSFSKGKNYIICDICGKVLFSPEEINKNCREKCNLASKIFSKLDDRDYPIIAKIKKFLYTTYKKLYGGL